jgi:phage shock protein PspC (stress-responsive transcriptional regulator)
MTEDATYRKLRRSRSDRVAAGVCGGLGTYFDVNPTFYRVGFAVLALLGGAGLLMYAAAALVVPDEGRDDSIVEEALRDHRDRPGRLVGLGLVSVAVIALLAHARLWPHGNLAWLLLLVAGLALFRSWRRSGPETVSASASPSPLTVIRRRSFPLTSAVLGLLVIGTGILGALNTWNVDLSWSVALASGAILVGVALLAGAFLRLRIGLLAVIGLVLGGAALFASTIDIHLNDGIGSRAYSPAGHARLRAHYRLGIGNLELDLSDIVLPPGRTQVDVEVGIGRLDVIVPAAANVRVVSQVSWGNSRVLGDDQNGHGVDDDVERGTNASQPTLVLDTHVGAGSVEVVRATS